VAYAEKKATQGEGAWVVINRDPQWASRRHPAEQHSTHRQPVTYHPLDWQPVTHRPVDCQPSDHLRPAPTGRHRRDATQKGTTGRHRWAAHLDHAGELHLGLLAPLALVHDIHHLRDGQRQGLQRALQLLAVPVGGVGHAVDANQLGPCPETQTQPCTSMCFSCSEISTEEQQLVKAEIVP